MPNIGGSLCTGGLEGLAERALSLRDREDGFEGLAGLAERALSLRDREDGRHFQRHAKDCTP